MTTFNVSLTVQITVGDPHPDTGPRVPADLTDEDTQTALAAAFSAHVHDLFMQDEDIPFDMLTVQGVHHG